MADWAKDCSPLVNLAEKHRGHPSYETLLPKYLKLAEQAESNLEFYQVARAYHDLICPAGHRHLIPENRLQAFALGTLLGITDFGISPFEINAARYWPRLSSRHPGSSSDIVPKVKACPAPQNHSIGPVANCICVELTDTVAYIRIKSMTPGGAWGVVFPCIHRKDGKIVRRFLEHGNGKYRKLIIDVRDNGGGTLYYVYENLIRPFLDAPVTSSQFAGMRRMYRDQLNESNLKALRKWISRDKEHVVKVEEVNVPEGFDSAEWVFYCVERRIEPRKRYRFDGSLYVLMNEQSFSAADDYADAVKRIGLGKLVGQRTEGGIAAYIGSSAIRLPASGMIFRVETEIVISPDGRVNEIFGTLPDVELPPADPPRSITKDELLKDEWIQHIVNKM
jgi:hypothetical protein